MTPTLRLACCATVLSAIAISYAQPVFTWAPTAQTTLIDGTPDGSRFVGAGSTKWFLWDTASNTVTLFSSYGASAQSMLIRITADGNTAFFDEPKADWLTSGGKPIAVCAKFDFPSMSSTLLGPVGTGYSGTSNSGFYDACADGQHASAMVWKNGGGTAPYYWSATSGFVLLPQTGTDLLSAERDQRHGHRHRRLGADQHSVGVHLGVQGR